jgi:hypothetical protein
MVNASDRQLPAPGQVFLDHIAWMAPDMKIAEGALGRLGLTLTPYSEHANRDPETGRLEAVGTANRLAMLRVGYLEILTPTGKADTRLSAHVQHCIGRHVGVHLAAFSVADAEAEARRIEQAGFRLEPTAHLRRTVETESGASAEVAFTVVRPSFDQFPEGRTQVLTHHTPEHMWQARYLPADCPYQALAEVAYVVDDPIEVAARFSSFLARPVSGTGGVSIRLDRGGLRFMTREEAAQAFGAANLPANPSISALTLSSRDLDRTRDLLLSNGLHPGCLGQKHLLIDAVEALGVHLVIVPA